MVLQHVVDMATGQCFGTASVLFHTANPASHVLLLAGLCHLSVS